MDSKLTILIVEDDDYTCRRFSELIDDSEEFILTGVTNNACTALEIIKDTLPEVVILDLELHLGGGSGLDVLSGLKDLELSRLPYILVTTNNTSAVTYESARQLGADYIMSKHQENYSEKTALDFLKMISSAIKSKRCAAALSGDLTESSDYYEKRIKRRITTELNHVGINPKSIGFKYLIEAVMITIKQRTPNVSNVIAQECGKTEAAVERAMQNAINRAWATSNVDDLLIYYTAKINSVKGVPTVTEFICYYANKIKNEY